LSAEGHNVETALTGHDGLAKLKDGKFDLAILDWALPDMNGAELARRSMEITPDTRIVILSGFGDSVQKEGLVPEGVRLVLSKPITVDELRSAVLKAMS
jgi:DNA-binding response OmpR family regulator